MTDAVMPGRAAPDLAGGARTAILLAYVEGHVSAGEAARRLGAGTAVVDVILEARARLGRLPDRRDAFTEGEYRRALTLLGLGEDPDDGLSTRSPS